MKPDDDKTRTHVVLTKGAMVSHYRIVEKIGAGGMGEVYLAEDTQLDRKVALKFLPPHLCQDEECRKRFKREAQAAAKLDHPNIVTIHEVGEYQGRPFFAMQHVEGRSLRDIKGEELDLDRIIGIAIQLCDGLQTAHAAGVIHRDIKPSNIVIDSSGRPKLLDFGLATIKDGEHLTKTGSTLGTIGYMSPEQIDGKVTDARSDLFSLGVVLYELIASKSPFRRDDETATLKAILQDTPQPLARYNSNVTDDLQRIITKLLEKDPTLRYQSASGVIPDLKKLSAGSSGSMEIRKKPFWYNRYVVVAEAVAILLTLAYFLFVYLGQPDRASTGEDRIMLAVLPFENLGDPEDDYFADGMTEEIIGKLTKLSGLGVKSRTSSMRYKKSNKNLRQIGEELGVDYVLEGSVRWVQTGGKSQVRVQSQLISVSTDAYVWADSYDAVLSNILEIQSEIAMSVASALDISLLVSEKEVLERAHEVDPVAYDLYLKSGIYNIYDYEVNQAAINNLLQALSIDPEFAAAHARLAAAMVIQFRWFGQSALDDTIEQARIHADRAIELDSSAADGYAALAGYLFDVEKDPGQAMYFLQLAATKEPDNVDVLERMGEVMFMEGEFTAARRFYERALVVDPARPQGMLATLLNWNREWQPLIDYYDRLIKFYPDSIRYKVFRAEAVGKKTLSIDSMKANLPIELDTMVSAYSNMRYWDALITAGLYDKAEQGARARLQTCQLAVDSAETYLFLTVVYWFREDDRYTLTADTTIKMFNAFLETESPAALRFDIVRTQLSMLHAAVGDTLIADSLCREVLAKAPAEDWSSLATILNVCVYTLTLIGEYDEAIDILYELMSRPSIVSLFDLMYDRAYDPLRDHPRFQALIEKYEKEDET